MVRQLELETDEMMEQQMDCMKDLMLGIQLAPEMDERLATRMERPTVPL